MSKRKKHGMLSYYTKQATLIAYPIISCWNTAPVSPQRLTQEIMKLAKALAPDCLSITSLFPIRRAASARPPAIDPALHQVCAETKAGTAR